MINHKYYNEFYKLGQQKISYKFFELILPEDDLVYTLKSIGGIIFTKFSAQYSTRGRIGYNPIPFHSNGRTIWRLRPPFLFCKNWKLHIV